MNVVKWIYVQGTVLFNLIMIFILFTYLLSDELDYIMDSLIMDLGVVILIFTILVLGNIYWRIFCELTTVLFSINSNLTSIDSKMNCKIKEENNILIIF
ncbi:hypothetical protein J2T59_000981 [Methanosalsum natronophilum]|nr:hypothetical protein [Methanosalsum natronophilum]